MKLILGDSLEKLKDLPTSTIDAICTDPPYGWRFMGKAWDGADIERVAKAKERGGMMADGKIRKPRDLPAESAGTYDTSSSGNQSFMFWTSDWARESLRVLKPGGHMLVFCGPRTYHAMAMGVEMAGFEIRDQLQWLFGSGFPKSMNVAIAIDKQAGAMKARGKGFRTAGAGDRKDIQDANGSIVASHEPITDDAKLWQGWGTALKPANEPIVLARKPLEKGLTVAQNVQKWGTGALNIDGTRIGYGDCEDIDFTRVQDGNIYGGNGIYGQAEQKQTTPLFKPGGRWPANVLFDEEAAAALDAQSGVLKKGGMQRGSVLRGKDSENTCLSGRNYARTTESNKSQCEGEYGASRFFYVAKSSKRERNAGLEGMPEKRHATFDCTDAGGNKLGRNGKEPTLPQKNHHPTVKPIKLMEYLCKLVTPPSGIVLDPFMGSGTTGCAAVKLGLQFIGIEREQEYIEIAKRRIEYWQEALEDEQLPLPLAKDANEPS